MILYTKQKQVIDMESRFVVDGGEGVGWMESLGLADTNYTFGMYGQKAYNVQHRELYVIGSLWCTTEIEETL